MSTPDAPVSRCSSCGADATGRFCAECGSTVGGAACARCRAPLSAGAKFCHRCGASAGSTVAAPAAMMGGSSTALPWAFAAIALLSFGAYVAAQRFGAVPIPTPSAAAAPASGAPAGPGGPFAAGDPNAPRAASAGDISSMSPEERADRLHDRLMRLYEEGKADSVQFFAPMGLAAFQALPTLDEHRRYDLGRIGEVSGALPLARAQADTILQTTPKHLLGLILAARVAELEGREADRARLTEQFVRASDAELTRNPLEYQLHANDINIALAEARRRR